MGAKNKPKERTGEDVSVDTGASESGTGKNLRSLTTYTKSIDLVDYEGIQDEVNEINAGLLEMKEAGINLVTQHQHRKWEYGMALSLIRLQAPEGEKSVLDVGAGESYFSTIMACRYGYSVLEYEPEMRFAVPRINAVNPWLVSKKSPPIAWLDRGVSALPDYKFSAVLCISVLEHLAPALEHEAWNHLASCVEVGGVLFITVDVVPKPGHYTFDNLRKQNFTPQDIKARSDQLLAKGFDYVGTPEWKYNGDYVHDYSFFSVGMRRVK